MRTRQQRGQSMVEYALGIGCISAICMLVLAGIGHSASDIMLSVLNSINDGSNTSWATDPGSNTVVKTGTTPWIPQ